MEYVEYKESTIIMYKHQLSIEKSKFDDFPMIGIKRIFCSLFIVSLYINICNKTNQSSFTI